MNPLANAEYGKIFTLDSTFISRVKYTRDGSDITIIFEKRPQQKLPEQVFLIPDGREYDYSSILCTFEGTFDTYYVETTDVMYYLYPCTTSDNPALGEELRVKVSFKIDITFDDSMETVPVIVKDVSAGGLKFISQEDFEIGQSFSFIFTMVRTPVIVTAKIIRKRPSRNPDIQYYGCKFHNLSAGAEAALRKFVFAEDLLTRRRGR